MTSNTPTMSLRVPDAMKERLDRMAKTLRRSRSSLMIEALERHLDDIQSQQADQQSMGRFTNIMKFKGAGVAITGGSSSSDIDVSIRNFRGDE